MQLKVLNPPTPATILIRYTSCCCCSAPHASQAMVESNAQRSAAPTAAGLFRMPGLFVRLSATKGAAAADPDTVWSPTSPLDFKSFRSSPPRVGLGLADALTVAAADGSSCCSVHHLGCRSSFLDSIRPFLELALPKAACGKAAASSPGVAAAADEVSSAYAADCEEYTCVISRGANPRTTHILAGETVEVRGSKGEESRAGCRKAIFSIEPLCEQQPSTSSPAGAAAPGRCRCCIKRLPEKMDIFMYLGKAFCSNECRKGYMEEEIEEAEEELMILDSALNL